MDEKEKELLELENLRLQKKERLVSIISTVIVTLAAVATAIASWFK